MRKPIKFLLFFILSIGILISCKKDEPEKDQYQSIKDNSLADGLFNRAYNQVNKAAYQVSGSKSEMDTITGCPVLYVSGSGYPKNVMLDFGNGCVCDDGVTRWGQIIFTISAPYLDSGTVVTSTFSGYHEIINNIDYQVSGTKVITNMGTNGLGHPVYRVDVQGASIVSQYGTISWASQRENEWIDGYDTWMNPWDNEYLVTGSADGTDINGDPFEVNITQALQVQVGCWYIKGGKMDIINPGYTTITVDFGDGTCDNIVYVIINGVTYTVVLG